ncbi:hypothetical protein HGP16_07000 [Rhizobium sp. P40RR-XXII]|uniref:hypothetical protein n=1 Tax=unclassified Rhizobium TaxID=2613769 RepID=UPI0014574EA6|nr:MULTISPECIES: hypothetical protein [unclassified Rhizobium]NLR84787.1 hypothetical protein [Rhizobium sp. P28RR-XV]NLS16306.1 hypothetical protein [Rhizobium sp. P40RR-XXII]
MPALNFLIRFASAFFTDRGANMAELYRTACIENPGYEIGYLSEIERTMADADVGFGLSPEGQFRPTNDPIFLPRE